MTQLSLIDPPAARRSDPVTSHLAADEVTRNGKRASQQREVLQALTRHPGATSAELATVSRFDRWTAGRRLPELEKAGHIRRGEPRKCRDKGRLSVTWWPVDVC